MSRINLIEIFSLSTSFYNSYLNKDAFIINEKLRKIRRYKYDLL